MNILNDDFAYSGNDNNKSTKIRYRALAMIFMSVIINYMDRSNISVAGTAISRDLHLTSVQLGLIFSAFGWSYAILQLPGGMLIEKLGSRITYTLSLFLWSVATLFQGLIRGFGGLFGLRISIGICEAPAFPINNRVVTSWFPDNERASAIGIYTSGQFVGLAFLTPVLTVLQEKFTWRGLFVLTGVIGITWSIIWYLRYRDPMDSKNVSKSELKYIKDGGGIVDRKNNNVAQDNNGKFTIKNIKSVVKYKKLWGIYIGQFAVNSTLWFFLTWFPTYLVKYRGLNFIKSGYLSSLPYLAAFLGVLLSGFISDNMLKKGVNVSFARKLPIIFGLCLSMFILGANYTNSTMLIIVFMTIAFFGNGLASITWVFVSELSPKHLIGTTGGMFNFIGGSASIVIPIVIGFLVKGGSFAPALIFIVCVTLVGILSYIFLVGKVERVA